MSSNITERRLETTALIDYYDGMAVLSSPTGLPPGSRVRFEFPDDNEDLRTFRGKIVKLKRRADGTFAVSVRLHNLDKSHREILEKTRRL
jgi:hypothetical protein